MIYAEAVAMITSIAAGSRVKNTLAPWKYLPLAPTRGYATRNTGTVKTGRQGFRGQKGDGRGGEMKVAKRDKNPGAFRAMPAVQLSHPLFESERRDELRLPIFHPQSITTSMIGKALKFPVIENDAFRIFGLPKSMLVEFRILSNPCSVVRDATVTAVGILQTASQKSSLDTRVILTGGPGCGKSFLLLQIVEYCMLNNWVVLYIPRAVNLVNSTTNYAYDPRTQTYLQHTFAFQMLQRFLSVNASKIGTLQMQRELQIERRAPIPKGTFLQELINIGLKEQALAPTILSTLLEELGQQTQYPIILAIDDFQALYCKTAYRDPHFVPIKSYHLSMPRLLMEYASGKKSFARGAVLGALSSSDPLFQIPPELCKALALPTDRPTGSIHKLSSVMMEYTNGLQPLSVPCQLSIQEATSLFEVWMKDKAIHSSSYDELFLSKYSESSGNARDFVWKGLLSTLET